MSSRQGSMSLGSDRQTDRPGSLDTFQFEEAELSCPKLEKQEANFTVSYVRTSRPVDITVDNARQPRVQPLQTWIGEDRNEVGPMSYLTETSTDGGGLSSISSSSMASSGDSGMA